MGDNGASAPFSVALLTTPGQSKPTATVMGKTYGAAIVLGAYGGKWDTARRMWTFPTEEDAANAAAECARLYTMRAARPKADDSPSSAE